MTPPRLATFSVNGSTRYGAVVDGGIVDLSARYAKVFPTLREVIAAGGRADAAGRRFREISRRILRFNAITWLPPIPAPEKIICIGVNYPDRNEEYKDGQAAPNIRACSAEDIDRAATAAAPRSSRGATWDLRCARSCCIGSPTPSRTMPRRSRCSNASTPGKPIASWPRPRSAPPRISVLRRQMRRSPRRPEHAQRRALERLHPRADRPRRRHYAVEHAVHALDVEDCPCAGRRLHRRAQAGGVVAGDGSVLARLVKEAGVPDGVLNTVHGFGEEAGKALTEHPAIKAIGFVGESATDPRS